METASEFEGAGETPCSSGREAGVAKLLGSRVRQRRERPVRYEAGLGAAGDGDQEVGCGQEIGRDQVLDGNGFGHGGAPRNGEGAVHG